MDRPIIGSISLSYEGSMRLDLSFDGLESRQDSIQGLDAGITLAVAMKASGTCPVTTAWTGRLRWEGPGDLSCRVNALRCRLVDEAHQEGPIGVLEVQSARQAEDLGALACFRVGAVGGDHGLLHTMPLLPAEVANHEDVVVAPGRGLGGHRGLKGQRTRYGCVGLDPHGSRTNHVFRLAALSIRFSDCHRYSGASPLAIQQGRPDVVKVAMNRPAQVAGLGSMSVLIVVGLECVGQIRTCQKQQVTSGQLYTWTWPRVLKVLASRWQFEVFEHTGFAAYGFLPKIAVSTAIFGQGALT
jgi:hypothetical protein